MTRHVAIYARCSTEEQTTENQIRELRAVAARHGWTVAAVFDATQALGTTWGRCAAEGGE
jgi:DNA invertase Pin-like site-specific DNA recombinase